MLQAEYIDYQVKNERSIGEFVTIKEYHGTVQGAKIRAKAQGWSLVAVRKVRRMK